MTTALFNAGMRIAKYIDPAVFYDKNVATPYIMSPYLASVNTLSAWPAPHRSHDAVLALENGNAGPESDDEHEGEEVPSEVVQYNKKAPPAVPIRYWSFHGFREDDVSNTLQRKPSRESLRREENIISNDEYKAREGSVRTQSTKHDDERMLTAENPNHRLALTRLGSYGRGPGLPPRNYHVGDSVLLGNFPEMSSDEEAHDDDNDSFYTAVEYIFENEVQPDGTIKPVKKKKSGLTVKKVRKSLHIPSAKTVQKNMRGLSIKRKDKGEKRTDSMSTDITSQDGSRASTDLPTTRKSIDLMRPFRFGHHDKETPSRKSLQLDRDLGNRSPQGVLARNSNSEERTLVSQSPRPSTDTQKTVRSSGPPAPTVSAANETIRLQPVPQAPRVVSKSIDDQVLASYPIAPSKSTSTPLGAVVSFAQVSTISPRVESISKQDQLRVATARETTGLSRSSSNTVSLESPAPIAPATADGISHKLDETLGPWRFSNPKIEPIEDTAFIFGDTSHSVKDRRKHFAKSAENRKLFEFDPDIVYCMSFFLPYMNFNTFDIKLGPLGANLHKYVDDQPIRYMARSSENPNEVYFMVEFNLE